MFNSLKVKKAEKEQKIIELENTISAKQQKYINIQHQIDVLRPTLSQLQAQIGEAQNIIEMTELGMEYTPQYLCLDDCTKQLNFYQRQIATLIASDKILNITREYRINGSEAKGRDFQKNYCQNLITGLEAYFAQKEKAITEANYCKTMELLSKAFDKYNKRASLIGISISPDYLDYRCKIIQTKLDMKIAKAKEMAQLKEERKRLKEQEKLLAEAEKERKRLEEEKKAMDIAFAQALTETEREKIKNKIQSIDKRIADVDYRVANSKAGWLYCISSPSLPNMIKIGVTRRITTVLRVRELSSSSLPFPFRTHCFVFSDDCFELESNMHKYFDTQRVSPDKEFFYIKPEEAIKVLKDKFGCKVLTYNLEEFEGEDE